MASVSTTMPGEHESLLEHMCELRFDEPAKNRRLTSVIGTLGRSSRTLPVIEDMIRAGMNIVRLNFSHEAHEAHEENIKMVRTAVERVSKELRYNMHVAIALDTKGPEIRTGSLEGIVDIELKKNEHLRLSINKDLIDKGTRETIFIDYPNIINVALPGTRMFIDDGAIALIVKEVSVDCVICVIEMGGMLGPRKNVTMPGVAVDLPPVSEKDRFDLKFGVERGVDVIFASKIRNAAAIAEIRSTLGPKGKNIKIIAKIENKQGLKDIDNIIAVSDGILFARADLGVELPHDKICLVQKAIFARCNRAGKSAICATQMMESMRWNPRPTGPEIADVTNAVLDGADCLMLSSETALGRFPVETITAMSNICREAEAALWYRNLFADLILRNPAIIDAAHAVAISAVDSARKALASAIIVLTTTGKSAYLISKYRPRCPIIAVTRCPKSARQTLLHRGIISVLYTEPSQDEWITEIDIRIQYGLWIGKRLQIVNVGDAVVILSPWKDGAGFTNTLRIIYAFFENQPYECLLKLDKKATDKLLDN